MKKHKITLIKGDGIGPEITQVCVDALDALGLDVRWDIQKAGLEALDHGLDVINDPLLESISKNKVCLKAPLTTPIGQGFRSVNVALRKHFDLFANIRPIKNNKGIKTKFEDVDLIIFRENTEDIYAGLEKMISPIEAHSIKVITKEKTERIAKKAFEYAHKQEIDKITVVTKANIMKLSDGLFLDVTRNVAKNYPHIYLEEILVDNMCMQLVMTPEKYNVILTSNLYGDILSDLAAGLVGGLGLISGSNIGEDVAIFEAVHGSAPDISGKGLANPTALLKACVTMLEHIEEYKLAEILDASIDTVLSDSKYFTKDLGGRASTQAYKTRLCEVIGTYDR